MPFRPTSENSIRWSDLFFSIEDAQGTSALTRESFGESGAGNDTGFLMRFFRHDQADEIQMMLQLDHGLALPQTAKLHIHLVPMIAPTGGTKVIAFDYKWTLATAGTGTIPRAIASWTASTATRNVVTAEVFQHIVMPICDITLPIDTPHSSVLLVRLARNLTTDTYEDNKTLGANSGAGNLGVLGFDLHVQRRRHGSVNEYTG